MNLKHFFMPAWMKHSEITSTLSDERKLNKAAIAGDNNEVKCVAIKKTGDLYTLRNIASDSQQPDYVRIEALKRLDDPDLSLQIFLSTRQAVDKRGEAYHYYSFREKLNACAFRGVRDMAVVRDFLTDKNQFRHFAIEEMSVFDPAVSSILQELINDPYEDILVRKAAVKAITDQDVLLRILTRLITAELENNEYSRNYMDVESTKDLLDCLLEKTGDQKSCELIIQAYISEKRLSGILFTAVNHSTNIALLQTLLKNIERSEAEFQRQNPKSAHFDRGASQSFDKIHSRISKLERSMKEQNLIKEFLQAK